MSTKKPILTPIFPPEILLMIANHLESGSQKQTLSSLTQTSQTVWKTLTPLLYRSITIPHQNTLAGIMNNFRPQRHGPSHNDLEIGKSRGLHLLRLIHHLTLEAMPQVDQSNSWQFPFSSVWHELGILSNHHSTLDAQTQNRLVRFTITGSAIEQLAVADTVAELTSRGYDERTAPSNQSGVTLATLISFYQPLQLILRHPLTRYPAPPKDLVQQPATLEKTRPYELVLTNGLEVLQGQGTTVCVHNIHDQSAPIGYIGAQHHISFTAFPSVPISEAAISHHVRLLQVKRIIRKSNPCIPILTTRTTVFNRPLTLEHWKASMEGCWTFYRVGAMITGSERRDEWFRGLNIEDQIRKWVEKEFTEEEGHPAGFAESVNARLRFVHGGPDFKPDDLICDGCGHKCRITSE